MIKLFQDLLSLVSRKCIEVKGFSSKQPENKHRQLHRGSLFDMIHQFLGSSANDSDSAIEKSRSE